MSEVDRVFPTEWEAWVLDNSATLLDVREPIEWAMGTLPGAVRISMRELVERVGEIDERRPVLVVCRSGVRSMHAARFLAGAGYRTANLEGGMKSLGMQD